jgi:DNA-binding LytR/AlgR family response regulator
MIKVLIIEDEAPARRKLVRFIEQLPEDIQIVNQIASVEEGILFLKAEVKVDVIFSDIELLDGNAFEIFKEVETTAPIIFTTAYNQFWMEAFETNGIEYLLKPFSFERFERAWNKFKTLRGGTSSTDILKTLNELLSAKTKEYKSRFTIKTVRETYFLETSSIAYFQADGGIVMAYDSSGRKHILQEATLKDIENQLSPNDFYRLNRSDLIHKFFVEKVERYNKNTVAVKLRGLDKMLISSQSSTAGFWEWMERN